MNRENLDLIHGYLDGVLTPDREAELNLWVKSDPGHANSFAEVVRLHDQLRSVIRSEQELGLASPRRSRRPAGPALGAGGD